MQQGLCWPVLAVGALAALNNLPAAAQSSEPVSSASGILEELIVTARKREENIQSTPISMTAFSGDGLADRGVVKLDQIANFVPNLVLQNNPSFGGASSTASVYIRGVGQKEFLPTTEPGVGLYVDGVYMARSVGAILDIIDMERIEVLRGPQGTLFGRNTIGGAISISTRAPTKEFAASGDLTVGSDNKLNVGGMLNVPLGERAAMHVSATSFKQDGYVQRVSDSQDLGNIDRTAGRAALRWQVSDSLELQFAADGTRARENAPAIELLGIDYRSDAFNPLEQPLLPPGSPATAGFYVTNPPFDAPTDNFAVLNNYGAFFLGGQPCLSDFGQPYNPQGSQSSPACYSDQYVLARGSDAGTAQSFSDLDSWGASITVNWSQDDFQLKSITAYRNLRSQFARDGDHSPLRLTHFFDDLEQEELSQELQFLGKGFDERLDWTAGLYYFRERGENVNLLEFTPVDFRSGGAFDTQSYAAYAQATMQLTARWSATAGVRYTRDDKTFLPDQIIFANRTPDPSLNPGTRILPFVEVSDTFDEATPLLSISFAPNDMAMLYATYSKGFKSGGFVQRVFPPLSAVPTFDPEVADVYELGLKTTFWSGRGRLNAAVFRTYYDDLQIQVFRAVAPVTENAASAVVSGGEIEFQALLGDSWHVDAGVGYLDPRYEDIDPAATEIDRSKEFERVSEWSLNASIAKEFRIENGGIITPRVNWAYRSEFFNDSFNTPEIAQDGYSLVDVILSWSSEGDRWHVTGGVTNLTDEDYLQSGVYGASFRQFEGLRARPREWYLQLKYSF